MTEVPAGVTPLLEKESPAGSLLGFFALTFVVTWTFFFAAVVLSRRFPLGASPGPGIHALILLGTFNPALALSVPMAWLYGHMRGSLFLVMLMHAAINNTIGIVARVARPSANPFVPDASFMTWLAVGLLWIPAAYFLVRMRKAELRGLRAATG